MLRLRRLPIAVDYIARQFHARASVHQEGCRFGNERQPVSRSSNVRRHEIKRGTEDIPVSDLGTVIFAPSVGRLGGGPTIALAYSVSTPNTVLGPRGRLRGGLPFMDRISATSILRGNVG
jgi:hypothetical protein